MVECGGLENRFTGNPGDEGSNPSSSARKLEALANAGAFSLMTSVWRARSRAKQTARYAGGRQPALQNHPPAGY